MKAMSEMKVEANSVGNTLNGYLIRDLYAVLMIISEYEEPQ